MPISIKEDVKKRYSLGESFFLRQVPPLVKGGSVLKAVQFDIGIQNLEQFLLSIDPFNAERDAVKQIASKFDLYGEFDVFETLYKFIIEARQYEKKQEKEIQAAVSNSYAYLTSIALGNKVNKKTFDREPDQPRSDENFVIFSDHHMTNFTKQTSRNYFKNFNYGLYVEVLTYYAKTDYCLVENGDVEDCLLFEPQAQDAKDRWNAAPHSFGINELDYPIKLEDPKWKTFLKIRYDQRLKTLTGIIGAHESYYELIKRKFISRNKYVRLAGNHDTYLNEIYELNLKNKIEGTLGVKIYDLLRINRDNKLQFLVLHGHQFDASCLQHSDPAFAKNLGEVYTENAGWATQGSDRIWRLDDTKKWYIGNTYKDLLVDGRALQVIPDKNVFKIAMDVWQALQDLLRVFKGKETIDCKPVFETLMTCEIAWEYFENSDAFLAFTLELLKGDDMYKLRHLDEVTLCTAYINLFYNLYNPNAPRDFSKAIPAIIIGHTHEPRKLHVTIPADHTSSANFGFSPALPRKSAPAVQERADEAPALLYLNTGSAGRYQNLIWCTEIKGNEANVCSWSKIDNQLKKITWKEQGDQLVHASSEMISV